LKSNPTIITSTLLTPSTNEKMSDNALMDGILPNEILEAAEEHKSPEDPNGYSCFKFNYRRSKDYSTTTYVPWEFHRVNPDTGVREWKRFNANFMNLPSVYSIKPIEERGTISGIRLCFGSTATFDQDGVTHEFGRAMLFVSEAFVWHVENGKKTGHFSRDKRICRPIKLVREVKKKLDDGSSVTVETKIEKPVIEISIPFRKPKVEGDEKGAQSGSGSTKSVKGKAPVAQSSSSEEEKIEPTRPPSCKIFDVTRQREDKFDPETDMPFAEAFIEENGKRVGPTYANIGQFITQSSSCSGTFDMASACQSGMGISLPCRFLFLIVKRAPPRSSNPSAFFKPSAYAQMKGANLQIVDEPSIPDQESIPGSSAPATTAPIRADPLAGMNPEDDGTEVDNENPPLPEGQEVDDEDL
jgi:hypothetical protein